MFKKGEGGGLKKREGGFEEGTEWTWEFIINTYVYLFKYSITLKNIQAI